MKKIKELQNLVIKKNDLLKKLVKKSEEKFKDGKYDDSIKLSKEDKEQNERIEVFQRKIKRLFQSLGKESVEKPKSVAYFDFKDFDEGLNYKIAKDILKDFGLKRLPSEYKDEPIEKIDKKMEKARENLNIIKIKLKDTAIPKYDMEEGFEKASPIKKRPLQKTLDLIGKQDILRRYIYTI